MMMVLMTVTLCLLLISDPTENLLKESKGTSWGPINTGVQKGKRRISAWASSSVGFTVITHNKPPYNTQYLKILILK